MAEPKEPLDHLEADATRDINDPIVIEFWGQKFKVLPMHKWKAAGLRAMREGDLDAWAQKCMDPRSYLLWTRKDPDLDEAGEFLTRWSDLAEEAVPNS